ncbi:hypothetical protein [Jonquetella anthropi]|uniref:hypothetical protein n=1 Tax=Jonquetella anthropi TaxID=428712 RepID=UPI0001B91202|nr:hypothetical protein [Jonquetella anthropi]EEX47841.1 hypothetical protein GCWU000246_01584 [Jonquetella anthropi E3_33 E1]
MTDEERMHRQLIENMQQNVRLIEQQIAALQRAFQDQIQNLSMQLSMIQRQIEANMHRHHSR